MSNKPLIAVTMGDPSGIGPEVVVKALSSPDVTSLCNAMVIGNAPLLGKTAQDLGIDLEIPRVSSVNEAEKHTISVLDMGNLNAEDVVPGELSAASGKACIEWVLKAGDLAISGLIRGIATAPINKEAAQAAGYSDVGHMELLQSLSKAKNVATMLMAGKLRVVHLTTHRSLARAVEYVTKENVFAKIDLTYRWFQEWGFSTPRIAIAALNPHGGEAGLLGREELDEIIPAVQAASDQGMVIDGPIPADAVFPQALAGKFDAVIVLYHDQGHIPIKVHDFEGSVSVNLGFPFIRTSVDHGTAFDIAGKGIADSTGMKEAIRVASLMASENRLPN